jgi:hemoglobin
MSDNTRSPYERIGGESGVRVLVDRFYDRMDELPEAAGVRALHAKSLRGSREKLFLFLSGWMGGPDLYQQKYGHPMLRRRHLPFPIGREERDQWLLCMDRALDEVVDDEALRAHLKQAFFQVADHMRNRAEVGEGDGLRIVGAPSR